MKVNGPVSAIGVILETSSGDAIEELPTITEYSKVKVMLAIDSC